MNLRFLMGVASLCLIAAPSAFGQETIPRHVLASGGTSASTVGISVQGTVGQSIIGRVSSSSATGALGFWHVLTPYSPSSVRDGSSAVTGADIATIQVYPHPVTTSSHVRLSVPSGRDVSLRLYDALGRVRRSLLSDERPDASPILLSADGLEAGTYTLVLVVDGHQHTKTIQVNR
jgi:hypothetical protein